ncbi:phosphotransferase family protein [Mycobacterium avium]|uniref:phosphotransferase family protein n=1 Tax=Mycobacterium avium TaxID=1764 RepID=UPI0003D23097|nr:phosphotransferase family protein [Mycobacterium avium]ETA96333.1 phosphotransferase [Mycobacterium avium 05-4293]MDV3300243.1 phosphotransferase family protein [Mycobacterium avium]PBA16116.1 phosphotransferase family protein [Mycobacterium avium]PBA91125.1 phosphotransferase family protein [Mycobacterium avium]PBJ52090.1 phosphotransferase family protein [Mycobacterium avium subsp. hominissuis]
MAYTSARGDVGDRVSEVLQSWLPSRLAAAEPTAFETSDFAVPQAGYSGRTVFFTAAWNDRAGMRHAEDLVLRTQADDHQLFAVPDAPRQAEVMQRLGAQGIPVPDIVGIERDAAVLGSPFYVMRRVRGRTPSDVPSWHKRGWTVDLSAAERELLCDNGLRALVDLHRVDDPETLRFLRGDADPAPTALQRYLDKLSDWYEWCRADLVVGTTTLADALQVILAAAPDTDAETVVWGDARVGNMCFGEDLSVVALFDWETAGTGPPDIDLGWWLMFERFLCEGLGFTRLPGVPDDDEIVRRYQQFGGTLTGDIAYYQLLGAFVLSLINNRLARLLVRDGLDSATAHSYPRTSVTLTECYLDKF